MFDLSSTVNRKFIDSISIDNLEILTDTGWEDVAAIHKTIPYDVYEIKTDDYELKCADDHILFDENENQIFVKDLIENQSKILTETGTKTVTQNINLKYKENMYDITVNSKNHRFYSNGILSHNSSVFEALCFVLFGIPYRNMNKPNLVNSINGKDCLVEIEFEINGKQYLIKRGIKPTIFDIYVDGVLVDQDSKSKDYQKYLEQNILQMNYKSFTQLVMLGSSDFIPFMQLTAQERREVIEELLDIRVFSRMNLVLKEKIGSHRENIRQHDKELVVIKNKIDLQKSHIDKLNQYNQDIINKNIEEVKGVNANIADLEVQYSDLLVKFTNLENSIKDKTSVYEKYSHSIKTKTTAISKINGLQKEIVFYQNNSNCPTCNQNIEEGWKHECTSERQKKIDILNRAIEDLEKIVDKSQTRLSEITKIEIEMSDVKSKINDISYRIQSAKEYISKIEKLNTNLKDNSGASQADKDLLTAFETEYTKYSDEKDKMIEELDHFDVCSALLKDTGIKTKIIKQYLPLMNKYINKYLNSMDFFVNFNLDENFKEVIKSRYRDEFQYESFSEGEKFRIDMALLLTWREISRQRNSTSTNLLIMDEVFDSSLDVSGTEEFLRLLVNLSKKVHIFVISHKPDSISHKFDSHLKAEKKNNFSSLT